MLAAGRGTSTFETRANGSIGEFEFGTLSDSRGSGFVWELRALDWVWLPNRPETRARLGFATFGPRYHLFTLFRRYTANLPIAYPIGSTVNGTQYFKLSERVISELSNEYLGVGAFARVGLLSWTYLDNGIDDPKTPYDPYVETGLFLSLGSSVEWFGGAEFSAGAAISTSSGGMLFLRAEAQAFGHRGRGKGPFSKIYLKKI
jgi:hypothetical protein